MTVRPPDSRRGRQHSGLNGIDGTGSDVSHILDAWRCWSWRTRHACDCGSPADCLLWAPLPVHDAQPCRGEFGDGGRWRPCCGR
jgi:hypothetical protein